MLRITKLKGAEYLINSVARGMDEYYTGDGEAPGVWRGSWVPELGLDGVVDADDLRAIVNGHDPRTGADLLAGHRERKVAALDVTLSVPKSVSLLWAFGSAETSATVSLAVVEATEAALGFLEPRAALARQQADGIRRQVPTDGFAIATFAHRTSRAGDPQLHSHCLIPNIVRRLDGVHVAFDANPLHVWGKAAGTVFLNHLERSLTQSLGVAWGPERNGTREMVGFSREQLRAFSKRTVAIEEHLEAAGELAFDSKAKRMWANDRASLDTRPDKDKTLTPERLRERWAEQAAAVGLDPGTGVDDLVVGRQLDRLGAPTQAEIFAALVDPETGLCANESRFCEAHVVERVAAISGGQLSLDEILATTEDFLGSGQAVRLVPDATRRRPAEWSTLELRRVEDGLLASLDVLATIPARPVSASLIEAALEAEPRPLGSDQIEAVRTLCGEGPAVRVLAAPAGYGKTTTLHAAVTAVESDGRCVLALAPTHKAVAELRAVGLKAQTIARFRTRLPDHPPGPDTTVIIDEVSQLATRDAAVIVEALAATPGAQVWFVGDARQGQSVAAGGLATELERRAADGAIPSASLDQNRRQVDATEREALEHYRAGDIEASQAIRTEAGWEHELACPTDTRQALAAAAVADADRHGVHNLAVLAPTHVDCEDLADRIRAIRAERGELRGPTLEGPGWATESRTYAAGDRVLLHASLAPGPDPAACNGMAGTALAVGIEGIEVASTMGTKHWFPLVSSPVTALTARPTFPTPGLEPSTGLREVPGDKSTCWRRRPSTATLATWARAGDNSRPTPGTSAPSPTIRRVCSPMTALLPKRCSTPCAETSPRVSLPSAIRGSSITALELSATSMPPLSPPVLPIASRNSKRLKPRSSEPPKSDTTPSAASPTTSASAGGSAHSRGSVKADEVTSPDTTRPSPAPTDVSNALSRHSMMPGWPSPTRRSVYANERVGIGKMAGAFNVWPSSSARSPVTGPA